MATNYAQKLERERQSPKGNQTKKENIGTDTGWMKANKRNEKIYSVGKKVANSIGKAGDYARLAFPVGMGGRTLRQDEVKKVKESNIYKELTKPRKPLIK